MLKQKKEVKEGFVKLNKIFESYVKGNQEAKQKNEKLYEKEKKRKACNLEIE